ncbi:response regulator transcription factor [uncultured Phenylobacterium sp.]|uniref:response regulator transcription factor n=1 Tax=uncultured Phenylobacterium sp. TaxID=349273 RepID=UPI0025F115EB|nr:response regulator transcription factor [uncultured Phenylobacterium sp.]
MKSCLICDDHAMMRDALAGAVQQAFPEANLTEAHDFPSAWIAARARPDLIVCDLVMPGADPEAGIAGVLAAAPGTPILVVTGNDDDALLLRLMQAGVAGFLPKSARSRVIASAITMILAGGRFLPMGRRDPPEAPSKRADVAPMRLTPRQTDIMRAMALGQTNKEIAKAFDLSPATVKAHATAAFLALGVTTRTEAAFKAREAGLI